MKRFLSFVTAALFLIWIMPLGVFVKPTQEESFCNGRRAVCLCSHLVAKNATKNAQKNFKQTTQRSAKEESNPFSHHYLFALLSFQHFRSSTGFGAEVFDRPMAVFADVREPVPKA